MAASFKFKNDFLALRKMSAWLEEAGTALGLSAEQRFELDLVANEAVTNVVSYGFPGGRAGSIEIRVSIEGDEVVLEIEDDGREFNPLQVDARISPDGLDEATVGGLGIHLIRMTVASCEYRRTASHNVFTMRSPLKGVQGAAAAPKD